MAISLADVLRVSLEVATTLVWSVGICLFGMVRSMTPYSWWPHKCVKDHVVLITGAGSGLGRLLAKEFARKQARLVLWDISEHGNQETAQLCRQCGAAEVCAYQVDLSSKDSTYEAGARTLADVGRVDILVNNAGIVNGKSIFDLKEEEIDRIFRINIISHFWTTKLFLPGMWERNHGHLVGISSAAGVHGAPMLADYCATKSAVNGFYQSMFGKTQLDNRTGVKITYVCPSYMSTGMFTGVKDMVGMPIMQPEDVAHQILEAVLTDQYVLMIPKLTYWLVLIKACTPSELDSFLSNKFKLYTSMQGFLGRNRRNVAVSN